MTCPRQRYTVPPSLYFHTSLPYDTEALTHAQCHTNPLLYVQVSFVPAWAQWKYALVYTFLLCDISIAVAI